MATKAQELLAKGIKEALANQKKLKGKPRSVGAAVKAGEKFFFDKKGVKKLAVTAATLKKEGKTLRQWANDFSKSSKPKSEVKTLKPRARPDTVTRVGSGMGSMSVAEKKEVDAANKAIKLQIKARKDTGPNAARKKPMAQKKVAPITFKMWQGMSRAERKSKGLPVSDIGGQLGFNRFKTGITGKEYDSKGNIVK
tara:strand:- start:74 stop:661 length:588 start_codon:yes stop_codon:yes gene_type:complete